MIRLIFAGWKDNHTSGAVLSLQNNSAERSRRIALTQQNAFLRVALETQHNAFLNSASHSPWVVRQVAF
ncbi:hypothetical protein [Leptospira noguchii]|uniref:hypothetical protein n=1 Tax=Leptospira noguchii TaxID=28182 RepID=UPI000B1D9484|nr:hypothetical protein [Leptospira noguchii]UOG48288.1 hypothetical protein MAL00_14935 [Leptospira noguchii]UOG60058.1 hypothetical protein MAL07_15120 [Leptospira noguchii]